MKYFLSFLSLLLVILIFNNAVVVGTQNGLLLWYQTLVPALLPFILVTNAMSETNAYQSAASIFQKFAPNRTYEVMAILLGNLCGYPIGGKILNDFVKNHCITPLQAHRLLALTCQSSPMFLIGYVHTHILQKQIPLPVFLGSIYLPVILYYLLHNISTPQRTNAMNCIPTPTFSVRDTFIHAVEIMVMIGVYVILFSILLAILLPFCEKPIFQLLLSFLEITTGLNLVKNIPFSDTINICFLCALSSFGGLCSAFQVKGVIEYSNNVIKKYLLDKCILSTGTFIIIYLYLTRL